MKGGKKTNTSPLEDCEQIAFVEWLDLQDLKYTAIPNNTYTKSWNQKLKNKRMGLHPGLSDLLVLVSPEKSKDGAGYALFVEMKRVKGGVQSKSQKAWETALNGLRTPYVQYYLCHGADEAIKVVSHYLKHINDNIF